MNSYSPKEYWKGVAENSRAADATGFAAVLHPDAPPWFNRRIDELQFRAVRRALALAEIPPGARVLDVGCGTGRWVRRFQQAGYRATGVDATPAMLCLARLHETALPLLAGEAHLLPFADAAFDCVSDITVVQHIPAPVQPKALAELLRVLKPDGRLILMELIRGRDKHIFPRTPEDWIKQVTKCGANLIGWFGQEFLLLDRLFVSAVQTIAGRNGGRSRGEEIPCVSSPGHRSSARRAYWGIRRVTAPFSAWTDPVCEKAFPARLATHGVFVFRK